MTMSKEELQKRLEEVTKALDIGIANVHALDGRKNELLFLLKKLEEQQVPAQEEAEKQA